MLPQRQASLLALLGLEQRAHCQKVAALKKQQAAREDHGRGQHQLQQQCAELSRMTLCSWMNKEGRVSPWWAMQTAEKRLYSWGNHLLRL